MTTDMNFKIRPARADEWPVLADLHYRAYYDRFFDPQARGKDGVPYGAPLAREFPVLAKGQNEDYFRRYWEKFVRNFDDGPRAQLCVRGRKRRPDCRVHQRQRQAAGR